MSVGLLVTRLANAQATGGSAAAPLPTRQVKTTTLFKSPHGLAWHDGALDSCDAGIHPGWEENTSPTHSYIFRIDLV
jgi:hypothetical protein